MTFLLLLWWLVQLRSLPKKTGAYNYDLLYFLAEQMCDLPARSRIYCSYGAIELEAVKGALPELGVEHNSIVSAIMQQRPAVQAARNPWRAWQKKNDWRAEGLLRFVGLTLPMEKTLVSTPVPPHRMIFDLPSYCYDMHTRVGLKVLHRLVQGVDGAEAIREFFRQNTAKSPHRALGEVLFFVEGGRIQGELIYEPLSCLEQLVFSHQYGLPLNRWLDLRALVERVAGRRSN